MSTLTHDPSECIKGLQQLLISDKKKIAFLFGAGTSLAKKDKNKDKDSIFVPAIDEMTQIIEETLKKNKEYKEALTKICAVIKDVGDKYNIESLLSNIELKIQIIGDETLNGLKKDGFENLRSDLKKEIKEQVSVHTKISEEDELRNLIHADFAEWIGRANRKQGIEIFTTNYDYLLELGLEYKNIPFYDGFTGSYEPFFNAESVEDMGFIPKQTKLWKIHGSLGWRYDDKVDKIFRKDSDSDDILIYPSAFKYAESKKQPYIALIDRLTNFLKQPDTLLITCGYSFGDQHINERIVTALNSDDSGHVVALFYDINYADSKKEYLLKENSILAKLAKKTKKISVYGCRNAIIGGQCGEWALKRKLSVEDDIKINTYFDEDAEIKDNDNKGNEIWTGKGDLMLPDFSTFVSFLQKMIIEDDSLGSEK